jgi:hypothetical protein
VLASGKVSRSATLTSSFIVPFITTGFGKTHLPSLPGNLS